MKRAVSLAIVCCLMCLTACSYYFDEIAVISDALGIDVSQGELKIYNDTHGGFHGDGELYVEMVFSDDAFTDRIKLSGEWSALPLPLTLRIVAYGGKLEGGSSYHSFIDDPDGENLIPLISNGYYYFRDRSSESRDERDPSQILDRYSYNFTLAIYDIDTRTLYFYEIDT